VGVNGGVFLFVPFLSFLLALALLNPFYPIQARPDKEVSVVAGTQAVPVTLRQDLKPRMEFNKEHIIKQEFDYSCGSAALATLLNYYLGEKLTERQVIDGLVEYGDKKQIEQLRAFSLLDMKRFVEKLGYHGTGYKADIDDLKAMGKPCIVPVEVYGYSHFCVFRGIVKDHVFLADPFMGDMSYPLDQFLKMWQRKIVFVVTDGDIVHSKLALRNDDLRFIDLDATRDALKNFSPPPFGEMDYILFQRAVNGVPAVPTVRR
jgi:predicted double-glycine peptidase